MGIFFQVRDDYLSLTSEDYWTKKGYCEDLKEKKYSYPTVYLFHHKLDRYEVVKNIFTQDYVSDVDIDVCLSVLKDSGSLHHTKNYLETLQDTLKDMCAPYMNVDQIIKNLVF